MVKNTLGLSSLCISLTLSTSLACGSGNKPDVPHREASPRPEFEAPKNVVLFLVDTLRSDHLGCYGYERDTSPRIDAFAAEGVLFENCIAQSTWTKPASASVLTGLYPSQHGMQSESAVLPQSVKNIAGLVKETGMLSAALVGNQYVFRAQGEMLREFDLSKGFSSKEPPSYARAEVIIDEALRWIERRGELPFLLYVHTVDPHAPYGGTPPFDTKFVDPDASDIGGRHVLDSSTAELSEMNAADRQRLIDLYDGDIAYTDDQFGRLLDGLTRMGRDADTMVVFVADHGEEFNEHGSWQHNPFMHPEVINVPLIMRMPTGSRGAFQGRRSDLCAQVDIVPTILDALGMWPRKGLSGRTLLIDPGSMSMPPVFSEIEGGTSIKALVSKDFKYVRRWSPNTQEQLFDLNADPDERKDIAKSNSDRLGEHRALMDAFLAKSSSGYSMLFQNEGDDWMKVDVLLSSDTPLDRVKLFFADTKARHGDKRDGPPELIAEAGRNEARVTLHIKPRDGDGVSFVPGEGCESIRVQFEINDQPADPQFVRLGPDGEAATQLPIDLVVADAASLGAPRPQARGKLNGDTYRVVLWSNMGMATEEVEISDEERANLEALGYAGEEDE